MNTTLTLQSSPTRTATTAPPPRPYEPTDAYRLYLREIGVLPLLTREEEAALGRRVRRGDAVARERMIQGNLRLVVKIARDYEGLGVPLLDLIAEGNVGLMRAVDKFDPERGAKLSVYASFWIKQSIRRALGNQSRTVRVPIHIHAKLVGLERAARQLQDLLGRAPTDAELSHETRLAPARLARIKRVSMSCASLDAPLGEEGESSLADVVPDEEARNPYEHLAGGSMRDLLGEMVGSLNSREAFILRRRFGLDDGEERTLEEVARELGLTRERIRQIQQGALKKLQRGIEARESIPAAA